MVKIHPSKWFASVMGSECHLYEVEVNRNFGESARKYTVVARNRYDAEHAAERKWEMDFPGYGITTIDETRRISDIDMVSIPFGLEDSLVNEMREAISGR